MQNFIVRNKEKTQNFIVTQQTLDKSTAKGGLLWAY